MDKRILLVLREMAMGYLVYDTSGYSCLHCAAVGYGLEGPDPSHEDVFHDKNCPVLVARAVLSELGMPLKLYCFSYEKAVPVLVKGELEHSWHPRSKQIKAFDMGAAWGNMGDSSEDLIRNVQVVSMVNL